MRYTIKFYNHYGYKIVNKFTTWEEAIRFIEGFNIPEGIPFKLVCKKA